MTIVHPIPTGISEPAVSRPSIARTRLPLDVKLFLGLVFMLPVQIQSDGLSRLSPSDAMLALLLLMAPGLVRLRSRAVDLLPIALVVTLAFGTMWAIIRAGDATNHTLFVKFAGSFVLALLAIVAATYTRAGWGDRILKSFIVGMAFWGVVAYIDWKFFNLLPFVEAKTSSRFGGMQYDPNNAGASYAVVILLGWMVGPRIFARRLTWFFAMAIAGAALALTLSRGGYIATAAAAFVILLVDRPSMQRGLRLAGAVSVVVVAAVASGVVTTATDDFSSRPDTVAGRGSLAENGIREFVDSGGLGIGLGTYRARYLDIIHNTGLWLVVEMSLLGLALLILMAVVPAQAALRIRARDVKLGGALLGAHVVMLVASSGIEALYQRPWWLIVGVIAGSAGRTEKHTARVLESNRSMRRANHRSP